MYTAKINWSKGQWEHVLMVDGKGYYAYLPAVFIYQDLNFGFFNYAEIENSYFKTKFYDYRAEHKGHTINKYFAGEALLLTPFFLIAHGLTLMTGYPADGYSQLYIIFLTIASIFYLCIGLLYFKKTLTLYNISERANIFIVLTLFFGTNLFYYSIVEGYMSHVYSFAVISFFIYNVKKYFQTFSNKNIIYAAIALGLIILIRPVNSIVVLSIPFLSNTFPIFLKGSKNYFQNKYMLILSIIILFTIPFIQCIVYKIQTGDFFVYSYINEGFNFLNPHFFDFLFSYKKGFFIYTPVCFIALFGLIPVFNNRYEFFWMLLFLFITIYILSSWWLWYYGGSFSSRVMVEYLPFFGILLALLMKWLTNRKVKIILTGFITLIIIFNQLQTFQYRYNIIHWSEMNKEKYWENFLNIRPIIEKKAEKEK